MRFSQLARNESGATAVEFSLVVVAFIVMVFGISYVGLMLFHKSSLKWAVERAARSAAIDTTITQSAMQTAVNGYLSGMGVPTATVTYVTGTSSGVPVGTLTASFTRNYTLPLVTTFTMTFTETAIIPQGS